MNIHTYYIYLYTLYAHAPIAAAAKQLRASSQLARAEPVRQTRFYVRPATKVRTAKQEGKEEAIQ